MRSDPTLRKWYRIINRKFFANELPDRVLVRWADHEFERKWESAYFGWAGRVKSIRHDYEIVLSRQHNTKASARLSTLAHEMCHIATGLKDSHGDAFEKQRQCIAERGIFRKHALHKNLTIF